MFNDQRLYLGRIGKPVLVALVTLMILIGIMMMTTGIANATQHRGGNGSLYPSHANCDAYV